MDDSRLTVSLDGALFPSHIAALSLGVLGAMGAILSVTGIDSAVPARFEAHLILDNYGTHKTPRIRRWLAQHPRFHLHFTRTGASWINLVERWFALLTDKQIRRSAHRSTGELETAIIECIRIHNPRPKPFVWTKTADEILASVARFCQRIERRLIKSQ